MPSNTLYWNKYNYILSRIDVASRYKVVRPLRTKQAKDVAEMIADIYKVGPLQTHSHSICESSEQDTHREIIQGARCTRVE